LDLPVDCGFPVSACSIPLFLDALQAPLQEIDLQRLLTDLPFQLGNPALRPTLFAVAGKDVTGSLAELPPPSLQNVGTDLQRTCRFRESIPLVPAAGRRPV
jgi:hypothetical protein